MLRTIVAAVVILFVGSLILADQPETVRCYWSPSPTPGVIAYNLYHSTNLDLPLSQWGRIAIFPGDATDGLFAKPLGPVDYYFLTASNCVGESFPFDR
jgi:hypothetical protein